jgi:hypothetical protein
MTKEKSQAEIEIEALADVFGIATTGFAEFYKKADNNNKESSASSGDGSKSASSGDGSKSASSGDGSTSASSGDGSTSASSGYNSKSASSGYNSTSASSGYNSTSASSGYNSKSASSGYNSTSASSGDGSKSASSGYNSTSASSGDGSKSASSGDYSKSASSGDSSACSALGYRAAVKGDKGNLIMASEYVIKDGKYIPVGGKADIVDGKKIKAGRWHIVEGGEWVEVDFTDGIFSRVMSNKSGVKKVKTDGGKILYIVSDDKGNSAHGKTIKEAREDLIYKVVAKFDGKLPKEATGKEWIGYYRAVTGACGAGVRHFVEQAGKSLDEVYTAKDIARIASGQFGHDKFIKAAGIKL